MTAGDYLDIDRARRFAELGKTPRGRILQSLHQLARRHENLIFARWMADAVIRGISDQLMREIGGGRR